jgi:aspartyl-tRNA(Asn)/glutamyl-tRNA(Gln) amidotransferase subunit A
METASLTITEARDLMTRGVLSPHSLTEACARQIERLNPLLNAFITVQAEESRGKETSPLLPNSLLSGIPIAIKDLYNTAGIRTTAGSLFFKDHVPQEDAFVVQKLFAAGAHSMGKTNTHEIALGLTNVNPHFGACRNPWDQTRVSGGSSGGSAVAVATGMALAALGTDTGGSIRVPAALCGIVGLKPTYGRVSLRGVLPLSWTLDHAGPLTKSTRDAALMLQVMAGYDEQDPGCADVPVDDYLTQLADGIRGWKIALAVGEYIEGSDAEVLAAYRAASRVLTDLGGLLTEIELPWLRDAALANALIVLSDGAAFHRERLAEHADWFGADVGQRLEMGAAYTAGEYARARRAQSEIRRAAEIFFKEYDLLILPTTPTPAPLIEGNDALEQARRLTRFTAPFNLTGLPAISLPGGFVKTPEVSSGSRGSSSAEKTSGVFLPIGLQMVSGHWQEAKLLRAAHAYEQATDWHSRKPAL